MLFIWPKLGRSCLPLLSILAILSINGCEGCGEKKPLQNITLSEEAKEVEVKFMRFDEDLFNADFSKPDIACQQLYQKYGSFYCSFIENDLMLAACGSDSVGKLLHPFVTNGDIIETHREIERLFTSEVMSKENAELTGALRNWRHYFPDSIVPAVIYYQSAWNTNISPSDSVIGISLDCYLGQTNKITQMLSTEAFPNYKKENMDEKFLVADAVKGWVAYQSRAYYHQKDLLSELIFYGKLMYIAEAMVPDLPDSILMNWSDRQWKWAVKNEWNTWKTIANEKVMYQTRGFEINKWFTDAPFTGANGIPQDSPPQLGVWLGWNIVRQYMASHPEVSLQQLMVESNNQAILSAFKPKR
jgi:hypothetical protein